MKKAEKVNPHRPDYLWNGRSLANYLAMHPKAKGAKTLTEARKLAFGAKAKRYSCCKIDCYQCRGK